MVRMKLATDAPKCTTGPYCPTDAPALAEVKAARVDNMPTLIWKGSFGTWAERIVSAGPCHLAIPLSLFSAKMTPAAITNTSQCTEKFCHQFCSGDTGINSNRVFAPITNPLAANAPRTPMTIPTAMISNKSNHSRSLSPFESCIGMDPVQWGVPNSNLTLEFALPQINPQG